MGSLEGAELGEAMRSAAIKVVAKYMQLRRMPAWFIDGSGGAPQLIRWDKSRKIIFVAAPQHVPDPDGGTEGRDVMTLIAIAFGADGTPDSQEMLITVPTGVESAAYVEWKMRMLLEEGWPDRTAEAPIA
jgi:hypothetical protein